MAYSTVDDLQQAFGGADRLTQALDWDADRVVDVDPVDRAIASADKYIDSLVGKQYRVPLVAPVPGIIAEVSARIAKYKILSSRGMVDKQTRDDYEDDVKWLEGVRDGDNSLGIEPPPPNASMRLDTTTSRPTTKDVSRLKLRGFS